MTNSGIDGDAVKRLAQVALAQDALKQEGKNIAAPEIGHSPGDPILPSGSLPADGGVGPGVIHIASNPAAPNATGKVTSEVIPLFSPKMKQLPVKLVKYGGQMTQYDEAHSQWHKP